MDSPLRTKIMEKGKVAEYMLTRKYKCLSITRRYSQMSVDPPLTMFINGLPLFDYLSNCYLMNNKATLIH